MEEKVRVYAVKKPGEITASTAFITEGKSNYILPPVPHPCQLDDFNLFAGRYILAEALSRSPLWLRSNLEQPLEIGVQVFPLATAEGFRRLNKKSDNIFEVVSVTELPFEAYLREKRKYNALKERTTEAQRRILEVHATCIKTHEEIRDEKLREVQIPQFSLTDLLPK